MFKNSISLEVEVMESVTFDDVDQIGKHQSTEYIGGWFPVMVELIEERKDVQNIIKGLNFNKESKIIATRHPHKFKRGDLVRMYGVEQFKIGAIASTIDPSFTNVVRMFPHSKDQYTWKVIELGGV